MTTRPRRTNFEADFLDKNGEGAKRRAMRLWKIPHRDISKVAIFVVPSKAYFGETRLGNLPPEVYYLACYTLPYWLLIVGYSC